MERAEGYKKGRTQTKPTMNLKELCDSLTKRKQFTTLRWSKVKFQKLQNKKFEHKMCKVLLSGRIFLYI